MRHQLCRCCRHFSIPNVVFAIIALLLTRAASASAQTRDPWRHPFAAASIWNTPIGSGAVYTPAGSNIGSLLALYADVELLHQTNRGEPYQAIYRPDSDTTSYVSINIADDYPTFAWTDSPFYHPNDAAEFLRTDGITLTHLQPLRYFQFSPPNGPTQWHAWYPGNESSLFGDGIAGSHSGSSLSAIGGSIRMGELESSSPIGHALKIELDWSQLYYNGGNPTNDYQTYRWPASKSDSGADNASIGYNGTTPALAMGSLLAIPPTDSGGHAITESSLGLTLPASRLIFHALQDYGAYVVDTSTGRVGGSAHPINLCVENGVTNQFQSAYNTPFVANSGTWYSEMNRIYSALQVVSNNGASSVGGGGTPRQAAAAPFAYGGWKVGTAQAVTSGSVIEAENYDVGGEGVSYHSATDINEADLNSQTVSTDPALYRNDGVSVYQDPGASGQYGVGWISAGNWTGYTIAVAATGTYDITVYAASQASGGGSCHLEFGPAGQIGGSGVTSTPSFQVTDTGNWSGTYHPTTVTGVPLTAGTKWMRFVADSGSYNLDRFMFTNFKAAAGPPVGHRIALKSNVTGCYTSCDLNNADDLRAAYATSVQAWEIYDVYAASNGMIALKAEATGKYVSCDLNNGDTLRGAYATTVQAWEEYTWQDQGSGIIALRANATGDYVSCDLNNGDALRAAFATTVGSWEQFTWQDLGTY